MRHSSGTWSYWLIAGQSYSGPIIANIAGAMMDMIIANIAEAITSIINHSHYNVFKDGLRLTTWKELLQFFAIHSSIDLHILLLLEHPYLRIPRTSISLIPFGRSLGPCESDSSDTPLEHHRLSQRTALVYCIVVWIVTLSSSVSLTTLVQPIISSPRIVELQQYYCGSTLYIKCSEFLLSYSYQFHVLLQNFFN
jgi:hypothetical protein